MSAMTPSSSRQPASPDASPRRAPPPPPPPATSSSNTPTHARQQASHHRQPSPPPPAPPAPPADHHRRRTPSPTARSHATTSLSRAAATTSSAAAAAATTTAAAAAHHKPPTPQPAHARSAPSHTDPVLPRNSRVRITGNNRTKWDLIGRDGLVRAAQTLGGWHEVQLSDGGIVRVQRNALKVIELPPPDPSTLVRIESARAAASVAAVVAPLPAPPAADAVRRSSPAKNGAAPSSPSRPLAPRTGAQSPVHAGATPPSVAPPVRKRPRKSGQRNRDKLKEAMKAQLEASNAAKSDAAKSRSVTPVGNDMHNATKSRSATPAANDTANAPLHANMSKLNVASLKRYLSVHNVNVASDCSKDELVGAVSRHFRQTTVNENEVISNFLRYLARRGGPAASD